MMAVRTLAGLILSANCIAAIAAAEVCEPASGNCDRAVEASDALLRRAERSEGTMMIQKKPAVGRYSSPLVDDKEDEQEQARPSALQEDRSGAAQAGGREKGRGRLAPGSPNLRNSVAYWGRITCQNPYGTEIGIRMKVNRYPDDIKFSVFPWQPKTSQLPGGKRDPPGVSYCRAPTTCTAEYSLNVAGAEPDPKPEPPTGRAPAGTRLETEAEYTGSVDRQYEFDSNPEHLDAGTGNHVMYDQCKWPTIGLSGHFKSDDEFVGDLVLTMPKAPDNSYGMNPLKARDDLGQDTTIPAVCQETEMAIKVSGLGYLSCNKFKLRKCVETEPQGHEWAVYMIKPEAMTDGKSPEPRISALAQKSSQNMLFNPIMWAATQNSRAEQLVTAVYMPPTMLAIDTYLHGLHTLGGSYNVILDPGLMSPRHQQRMDRALVLRTLATFTGVDHIVSQYATMTSLCPGSKYPEKMYRQSSIACGVDPSAESVAAQGTEYERLWGWKGRMKAYNHRRVLVYAHGYFFSDAGLEDLTGGTAEAMEVRVLSENNRWRKTSDPHCWEGQP